MALSNGADNDFRANNGEGLNNNGDGPRERNANYGSGQEYADARDTQAQARRAARVITPQAAAVPRNDIMAPMNYQAQARARQQALIDQLHGIATGQIKSPAQDIYEQQVQQAQNQNTSQSSDLRDVGAGGQMHIAEQNANTINQNGMAGGARLQAQQQQQAQQLLAKLYQHQRDGDLSTADINTQGILGNNALNDARQTSIDGDALTANLSSIENQNLRANATLGYGLEDAQRLGEHAKDIAGAGAGLFGYLQQSGAGGSGSGGNKYGEETTNYGDNTGHTSTGKQRGFDITGGDK